MKLNDHTLSLMSIVIAGLAVALSQFPPIYTFFQKEVIEIGNNPEIYITHSFGNIGITKRTTIKNVGSASGEINKLGLYIAKKDDVTNGMFFPARYFYKKEKDLMAIERGKIGFSEFFISPSTSWDQDTVFYRRDSIREYEQRGKIERMAIDEHIAWEDNLRENEFMDDDEIYEYETTNPLKFSELLRTDIQEFIKLRLSWLESGEYILVEHVQHDDDRTSSYYSFNISTSTIAALDDVSKRHNYFIDKYSEVPKGSYLDLLLFEPSKKMKKSLDNVLKSLH